MPPTWSNAAGVAVAIASLPLGAAASAQPTEEPTLCTVGDVQTDQDGAAEQLEALIGEVRDGLIYFGHDLRAAGCEATATFSLWRYGEEWRIDVRGMGETRRFFAPPDADARVMAPDIVRYLDATLLGEQPVGAVLRESRRASRRASSSAPESGTVWFPTIGFLAGVSDRASDENYFYYYFNSDPDSDPGHANGKMVPIFSATLGAAVRWHAERDVSGQIELQIEQRGGQSADEYVPFLWSGQERALQLMIPAFARFRLSAPSPYDRHAYVGGAVGLRLHEFYSRRVIGVPLAFYDLYNDEVFGRGVVGLLGGFQVERPGRVRADGTVRRRELDIRFNAVASIASYGPRYGGDVALRWRFGR